ncbi:MAG: lasso peptide biosynthesis B2 protein [Candidatus Eremiobacteraeota bacterium]|nr:lasso peptide biosynthesis B2 protein [Candidatus Eremiobacteraeota bacterium]
MVLDLNTETYRVLDDVASALWSVLTGESDTAGTFDRIARDFDVDRNRFESDLAAFARRCVTERVLEPSGAAAALRSATPARVPSRGTRPTTLAALFCLIGTRRALGRDGFRKTYERYALLPASSRTRRLGAALPAFARAENFFVARRAPEDCLLRSLSLYRFLRSAGVPAEHLIGVRRFPFAAHAWVECDGSPVCDELARGFTPLARIGDRSAIP